MINEHDAPGNHGLSRREVLRRLGLVGAAAFVTPAVLAACGSDDNKSAPATTGAAAGSTATSGAGVARAPSGRLR